MNSDCVYRATEQNQATITPEYLYFCGWLSGSYFLINRIKGKLRARNPQTCRLASDFQRSYSYYDNLHVYRELTYRKTQNVLLSNIKKYYDCIYKTTLQYAKNILSNVTFIGKRSWIFFNQLQKKNFMKVMNV